MTQQTNADRTRRAQALIDARNSAIGLPSLVLQIRARDELVKNIVTLARRRKFAIKVQQKIDRALESYIRRNFTDWKPTESEAIRAEYNKKVAAMIKEARAVYKKAANGSGEIVQTDLPHDLLTIVQKTDIARGPMDEVRDDSTAGIEELAAQLPVAPWVESIPGAGILGLALIVAEAGPLDNYANPEKLWKRLGFAPYDGHAGSTWKRETWRPRKLDKEEWIANPFSGERYATMYTIALWLVNKQWISAAKAGADEGHPNGRYGEVYAARRIRTEISHPEWTPGHRRQDGLRIAFKQFLVDLWEQWVDQATNDLGHMSNDAQNGAAEIAVGQHAADAQRSHAGGIYSNGLGQRIHDAQRRFAEIAADGQAAHDAQDSSALGGTNDLGHVVLDAHGMGAEVAADGHCSVDPQIASAVGGPKKRKRKNLGHELRDAHASPAETAAAGHAPNDPPLRVARGGTNSKKLLGQKLVGSQKLHAEQAAEGHVTHDAQVQVALGGTKKKSRPNVL
jgi:hypothetical protein